MNNRETIYSNVKHILTHLPSSRDNNNYLWFTFLEMYSVLDSSYSISSLYDHLERKRIPSFETLARFSRQIQEKNPELRGKEWLKRQRKQVKAKEDLGYKTHIAI